MSGRPWTMAEERLIALGAGIETVKQLAGRLGRSEDSVRSHAKEMRAQGRLKRSLRMDSEIEYVSDLTECSECGTPRTSVDAYGICDVCRDRQRLKRYHEQAERAFASMPRELRERSTAAHDVTRTIKDLPPIPPNTSGMDEFWSAKARDDYYVQLEEYELRKLRLDKDAVKQRKSKWLRKAREWRAARRG